MVWRRLGRFVVTVHSEREPLDEEWSRYVASAREYLPLLDQRILVISGGGAPNAAQRRQLVTLLEGGLAPTAILTGSWLMRGAGTAVSWFNPSLRVFGLDGLAQAMDHLQLNDTERKVGIAYVQELQSRLGVNLVQPLRPNFQVPDASQQPPTDRP